VIRITAPMNIAAQSRDHRSGKEREQQMNTDRDTQEREIIFLTDAELDAVIGGKVAMQDFHFVKHVDKASAKLY
jgi:type VI protein secretion system component Hcp